MKNILEYAKAVYALKTFEIKSIPGHEGGRNQVYICSENNENKYVLRISALGDKKEEDYLAETEFVHYLAQNGASVADVFPSVNGKYVEKYEENGIEVYLSIFAYAKGMLISDNGYRYRDGAPLTEYFYNTGKTLGKIHQLSKTYTANNTRADYFDIYNEDYINKLIPDIYEDLKCAIYNRLQQFRKFSKQKNNYGLVHFDYSDGNYHIDMNTGELTVFDFDNCINCWYMFDLANLWTHGFGWCQFESDPQKRFDFMKMYFETILTGYRSETDIGEGDLLELPLFIDMVLIENIVDEFECCVREGEELDYEDIEDAAECLIRNIPYAGIMENEFFED